jgi:hypothetical protein
MLFRAEADLKTMKIMKGDETVMIGERTVPHLYKLQGCTIAGGWSHGRWSCKGSSVF